MEERKLIPVKELREQVRREVKDASISAELLSALNKYPDTKPVQFVTVVAPDDEPYISTELKTGLFGVTKETIRRARRVVIAYSQGAKQGVGGHLLGRKVFGLVSRLRGVPAGVSLISPFPFHNCYSIEDVKAFIDAFADDQPQDNDQHQSLALPRYRVHRIGPCPHRQGQPDGDRGLARRAAGGHRCCA